VDLDRSTGDSYLAYDRVGVFKRRNVQEDLVDGLPFLTKGGSQPG